MTCRRFTYVSDVLAWLLSESSFGARSSFVILHSLPYGELDHVVTHSYVGLGLSLRRE